MDSGGFEELTARWIEAETYSAFYVACPEFVESFEKATPWTNFYEAIERCDVRMDALLRAIDSGDFRVPLDAFRSSKLERAFELTVRLLSCLEDAFEEARRESWVGAYISFKLSNDNVEDGSMT